MLKLSSSLPDPKLSFSVDKVVDALRVTHRSGARSKPDIGNMCVGVIQVGEDVDRGRATNTNGEGSDILEVQQ